MTVYYVSPNGSNSDSGTIDQPFASLQHAHDLAQPGDEILLRGGTYRLSDGIRLTNDGTSSEPITVRNYDGEVPVLDGSAMTSDSATGGYVLDLSGVAWNTVSGLQVTGGPEGGLIIHDNSHDNVIEQLDVSHNGRLSEWEGKGISLFDTSYNNLLLNNDSHDNRDLNLDNADGFQISTSGAGNVLRGNRAYNNSDDGFDLFNVFDGTDAGSVVLDQNWAFHNGYADGDEPAGDGNGFKLGGQRAGSGGTSGGHTVTNNIAYGNRGSGFDENEATDPLTLTNNTAYDNASYNFGFYEGENLFENNLSLGTGRVSASGSGSNNSWDLDDAAGLGDLPSQFDPSLLDAERGGNGGLPSSLVASIDESAGLLLGAVVPAASEPGSAGSGASGPIASEPVVSEPSAAQPAAPTQPVASPSAPSGGSQNFDDDVALVNGNDGATAETGNTPRPETESDWHGWRHGGHHDGQWGHRGWDGEASQSWHDAAAHASGSQDIFAGSLPG
ncbi:MAG: right-handed parallel beta-helix repeat-containing protein [Methylobacterium frigidaeris]